MGAVVVVVAFGSVIAENTAFLCVAEVVGAGVAVGAGEFTRADTGGILAQIADRARVPIGAGQQIGRKDAARFRFATVCCARVSVVTGGDSAGQAQAAAAAVADGANAAIAAGDAVIGAGRTALDGVASVERARVLVVADHRRADALAVVAGVAAGAGAVVLAGARLGWVLAFSGDAVVVATRLLIVAHSRGWLVGLTVAVVVLEVAGFDLSARCVAGSKADGAASPLAHTVSSRVSVAARRDQLQTGRAGIAKALQVRLDALVAFDAANTRCFFAGIAAAAVAVAAAFVATEVADQAAAAVLVADAPGVGAAQNVVAIAICGAWLAQSGVRGHAQVDDVAAGPGDLRAFEPRVTAICAEFGALLAACGLDALPRIALLVVRARAPRISTTCVACNRICWWCSVDLGCVACGNVG